jgi:WD40 repeat protein
VLLADFAAHPGIAVHDIEFSDDGRLLVTGAADGEVLMWDVSDPRAQPSRIGPPLTGHTDAVRDVQFDKAGRHLLATGSDDGTVKLWDLADPQDPHRLGDLDDPRGPVNDVTFSRDGLTLFAASDDGNVWGWDVSRADRPTPLGRPLAGHRGPVYDQELVGPHILATAGEDRTVRFWDISDAHHPRQLGPVITHADAVVDTNVADDVNRIATASGDRTVRLWDVAPLLAGPPGNVVQLACARADGGLGKADWATYIPDMSFRQTC